MEWIKGNSSRPCEIESSVNSLHLLLEKVKKSGGKNSSPIKLTIILEYVLGILVCHFIPQSKTASAQYYKSFLQYHLHHALREKHSELV
jgi:hypothetical protein